MDQFWDIFLWSAIPIAVLLIGALVVMYWYPRRRQTPLDGSPARVARAYREATHGNLAGHAAPHS
jgi:cytochrome c-type biogenesis protein CcmH/NrfF